MYIIVYFFLFYNFYAIIRTGETMRSIKETTTNTIIIKKSEFITTLIPCNDEKEIKDLIELGSLTVVSNFSLTKSLKTLIISMLLSFFIVKFVKIIVLIWANVCYNGHRR